jgi:hypothetical protein
MRFPVKAFYALTPVIGVAAITGLGLRQPAADFAEVGSSRRPALLWNDDVVRGQELDDQLKQVLLRSDAKDAVVADLIDGRLTLFEAAARFRAVNESNPQAEQWLTGFPLGDQPYETALCRSVIRRVEVELRPRGSKLGHGIVARLEAQLADHLKRHGSVRLPE